MSGDKPKRRRVVVSDGPVRDSDPAAVAFSKKVNKLMLERGWNQSDLARYASRHMPEGEKIDRGVVSTWVNAKHIGTPLRVAAAAKAFGISVDELMEGSAHVIDGRPKPMTSMSMTPDGRARVKLDLELPTEIAIEILKLAQQGTA